MTNTRKDLEKFFNDAPRPFVNPLWLMSQKEIKEAFKDVENPMKPAVDTQEPKE